MGKLQSGSDTPASGRHEFTREERQRGQRTSASRARRHRQAESQARRQWMRVDRQLWDALQEAEAHGTDRELAQARRAWTEHQALLPVTGRRR